MNRRSQIPQARSHRKSFNFLCYENCILWFDYACFLLWSNDGWIKQRKHLGWVWDCFCGDLVICQGLDEQGSESGRKEITRTEVQDVHGSNDE
ncbi:hypothetical protein D3C86_1638000 [compost metagenome]